MSMTGEILFHHAITATRVKAIKWGSGTSGVYLDGTNFIGAC
ncbi:hypothetical protein IMM1_05390 [Pseudocoprococcus immobilis]